MSFDWSEYLSLAQELAGQSGRVANQESKYRSAISRAYYAAFCKARNYLRDVEGQAIPAGGKSHTYVRDEYRNNSTRTRRRIGEKLNRLRSDRNRADYEDVFTRPSDVAIESIRLSREIISLLDTL